MNDDAAPERLDDELPQGPMRSGMVAPGARARVVVSVVVGLLVAALLAILLSRL